MTEELLEAIYASPDDDAPRLVYADALLERGDPRGELIVRQCRGDAASDLVEQYGDAWLGELAGVVMTATYERGFLARVTIREPRDDKAIAALVGHPLWRTVRKLRGSAAIALHPSMTALRVLHVEREPAYWKELFSGTERNITELHYTPLIEETWSNGGDVTATPNSGGVWHRGFSREELGAMAACKALPALRRFIVNEVPGNWFGWVLQDGLLARVHVIESRDGPLHVKIAGGVAVVTVAPTAAPMVTDVVINLVQALPKQLAIELVTGPRFAGREILERIVGPRLRR